MPILHALTSAIALVALNLPASGAGPARPVNKLCTLANAQFPGKVGFSNSPIYQNSQASFYTADERSETPDCVFAASSAEDVASFVKLAAANDNCKTCPVSKPLFAVRGGGHTLWAGAANADGAVTVDLRQLNSFSLSADAANASIGAGSDFGETVYPNLVPHNRTVIGARVPGVTAGGFLSGGGKNFWSRRYGFGCDNIWGYQIVLANGDLVYASAEENVDLWLAVKGGSNNFGIITRYDLATYPLGLMWGGTQSVNFSSATLAAQAQAFSDFMLPQNVDKEADVGVLIGFVDGEYFLENTIFYSADEVNPPVFHNFTSLPGITSQDLSLSTVAERVTADGSVVPATIQRSFELVYSFSNADAATYVKLFNTLQSGLAKVTSVDGLEIQYLLQPLPVTNGTNSIGITPHDTDLVMVVFTGAWANTSDDSAVIGAMSAITATHQAILLAKGLLINYKYLNYADVSQNPIATYGAANIAKLWATSKKYDPKGFFQTRVPGYKLPRV